MGVAFSLGSATSHGNDPLTLYTAKIKPLLKERCFACHGALKQESELRLDTGDSIRRGGESGLVIESDAPEASTLLKRVTEEDDSLRMPPIGQPLTSEQVEWLQQWITAGAPTPKGEAPEADPAEHWAFQPPRKATVPVAETRPDWPANPIDSFLNAGYEREGLTPAPDTDPAVLLRRVHLDLTGLPPTEEQVQDFLRHKNYEAVVDHLLESPQYGERWARHWMDIWRYSDWYGRRQQNDVRNSAPQIWRWRDWIVNSLNDDKSYAQMVREMLAADELHPDDDSTWPATGYLIRSYYSLNPNEWMRHNVEYTTKAFLALTFNCAHCHDHKYDPIAHEDYFRMRAFFEPMGIRQDRVLGEPEPPPFERYKYGGSRKVVRLGMVRIYDEHPEAPTWFYTGGDERNKVKQRGSIGAGVPSFLNTPFPKIQPVELSTEGWYPGARQHIQQAILAEQKAALVVEESRLTQLSTSETSNKELRAEIREAESAVKVALERAAMKSPGPAIAGRQSLLLSAETGRRIAHHSLSHLKSVPDGTTIAFRLRILQDGHINFQLARDTTKHLTALYIGFVGGEIRSYHPGGFQNLVAGRYDIDKGQTDFLVRLVLRPATDTAELTVMTADQQSLVESTPIALNGWNAAKHPHQPLTLDCREGTRALIDDVFVSAGEQEFQWDFEPPQFIEGQDVSGIDGWTIYDPAAKQEIARRVEDSELTAPYSVVSATAGDPEAWSAFQKLRSAKAAWRNQSLPQLAAEAAVTAARKRLAATEATIAADQASQHPDAERSVTLAQAAKRAQLDADVAAAQYKSLEFRRQHQVAQSLPDGDKTKPQQVSTASKNLESAKQELIRVKEVWTKRDESDVKYERLSPTTARKSTGRRRALAIWITDRRNPLTARVAINHIWMRHFHQPLVASVYDFGRNGKTPTHPELLDWLAVELMENNWSMKHIHRLIVTSRAYRMSSSAKNVDGNLKRDKDNRLLWRMNLGRMESEVVRDSILAIAKKLDDTQGGQPLLNTQALSTYRRSLYYEIFPENGGVNALGEVFDPPDPTDCFRRTSTIVPQQALALGNSKLIHMASEAVTSDLMKGAAKPDADAAFVDAAFVRVLSRHPAPSEMEATLRFLTKQQELVPQSAAREGLVRVLFNHNDFVTIR